MKKDLEIRSYSGENAPKINDRTIEGYAIVFNQRSEVMLDWHSDYGLRKFQEIILPTAINEEFLNGSDIRALIEHNRERLLARFNKGKGTLELTLDDHGMKYRFDAPNTADGDYAVEMVGRGDIQGSSFAFKSEKDKDVWTKEGDLWIRTIHKFSVVRDVTITTDPAYTQTEVSVRNLLDMEVPEEPKPYKVKLLKRRLLIN